MKKNLLVAMTRLTILKFHGVTIEARSTEATSRSKSVIQTLEAITADGIAGLRIINVNVVGTIAGFAVIADNFRLSVKSRSARFAKWAGVTRFAFASNFRPFR